MKKLLLLLLCVPLVVCSQHRKGKELASFLNSYKCSCDCPEGIGVTSYKLDSISVISWVLDDMWKYDMETYEECVTDQREYVTHYTDWGDIRYFYLSELADKYFQTIKILASEEEFKLIEENQRKWDEYNTGWTKEGYKLISQMSGWFPKALRIQESLIEIHELRIKQLEIMTQFLLDD